MDFFRIKRMRIRKKFQMQGLRGKRSETYLVRYVAATKAERNTVDGFFLNQENEDSQKVPDARLARKEE
ncbi:hypothetical protein OR1_02338 [Geobacter sp. OR-1]|nr:hypothetical protein OR1_02338 [Geobacter sp. OR-1]